MEHLSHFLANLGKVKGVYLIVFQRVRYRAVNYTKPFKIRSKKRIQHMKRCLTAKEGLAVAVRYMCAVHGYCAVKWNQHNHISLQMSFFLASMRVYFDYGLDLMACHINIIIVICYFNIVNFSMISGIIIINNWFKFCISAYLGLFGHLGISWYLWVLKDMLWKCDSRYMVSEIFNPFWVECISRKAAIYLPCLSLMW
jgi:hypothetical protein